jgi:excisionase family DNA binding protein
MPQPDDRQVMADAEKIWHTKMQDLTTAAARHGVSYTVMYRKVQRGEIEGVKFGREMRVWADT